MLFRAQAPDHIVRFEPDVSKDDAVFTLEPRVGAKRLSGGRGDADPDPAGRAVAGEHDPSGEGLGKAAATPCERKRTDHGADHAIGLQAARRPEMPGAELHEPQDTRKRCDPKSDAASPKEQQGLKGCDDVGCGRQAGTIIQRSVTAPFCTLSWSEILLLRF